MDPTATVLVCVLSALLVFTSLTALLVWLVRATSSASAALDRSLPVGLESVTPRASCLWLPETAWSEDEENAGEMRRRAYERWDRLREDVETVRRVIGV